MHKRPYEKLVTWQEAHQLCVDVCNRVKSFPDYERFGLTGQMCRSSGSVVHNIVEGSTRYSFKEKRRFYNISLASLEELHSQVRIAYDVSYISSDEYEKFNDHINRVSYLLTHLIRSVG